MKKILKKEVIIAFIIGIILASSIAVYAYSYAAKDVSYTKPGENTPIDVERALNDLYTKSSTTTTKGTEWNEGNGTVANGKISFDVGFDSPSEIWVRMSSLSDKCIAYRFYKTSSGYTKLAVTVNGTTGTITSAENQTPMNGSVFTLNVTASTWNGSNFRYIAIR